MSRIQERQKVIELRKRGKTYSEIRKVLAIPKSTLSDWLSKYPLTQKQLNRIEKTRRKNKYLSIEKIRHTKLKKREARINKIYQEEQRRLLPLSSKEFEIAGAFLYWGEGNKGMKNSLSLNNTDPEVVKFTLYWFKNTLKIPKEKIKVSLHLYNDMNPTEELKFWSQELKLPLSQFMKPYIKKSNRSTIDHKGSFGHGTCGVVVNDVRLKERIIMQIKAVAEYYSTKI